MKIYSGGRRSAFDPLNNPAVIMQDHILRGIPLQVINADQDKYFSGLARGFNDANLMPILRQIIDSRYVATGYGFLNFLSTIVGGGMVYVGGALQDAQVSLSIVYQISALIMLVATWSLFMVRIRKNR